MNLAWVAAAALAGAAEHKPNVLWLVAEDLGPHLACMGTKEVWTPNLDLMAREGMLYRRCFATCPVCSPSRSAFMTAMYQTAIEAHQHRSHRDDGKGPPPGVTLVSERFRKAGIKTGNLRALPPEFEFRGTGKTDWNFHWPTPPFDFSRWDEMKASQPFFAQLNFSETHRKFTAPKKADPAKVEIPPYYPDHPVTRRDWAEYLDALSELDRKIGLVLARLERDGLAENTIVVFFGDNGQAHVRGKQFCYDSGLNVPLVVRWPKGIAAPAGYQPGTTSDRLVELIDVGPTCLTLAGAGKPRGVNGQVFLGTEADPPRRYAFGARDRCDETPFRFRTVRDERFRYIRNFTPDKPFLQSNQYKERSYPVWNLLKELHAAGKLTPAAEFLCQPTMPEEELYDTVSDPHETVNLAKDAKYQADRARLRTELEKWIEATNDGGRNQEPESLIQSKGTTRPETHPNTGYVWGETPGQPKGGRKKAK
ncbi:MAG TPA: sulfatase [Planctomycetia bacterium]|nr:sulfatase [Planctomycetia bacterium]